MKKILLGFYLSIFSFACFGQVIFYVEEPASISNNYSFTYTDPGGGWSLTPDLIDPLNAVQDTLMLADDGTGDDSLACNPLVNDLTGKIAVCYRGACQFGLKAKKAQDAGALALIIINHSPGTVGMAPGDSGALVTIPVVMVSDADGAIIRAQMDAGEDVVAFIGNKVGYYADDLGFFGDDIHRPKAFSNPLALSADNTEYDVQPGAWVHNYGTNQQLGVAVNAQITLGGTVLYDQTSSTSDISFGDSAFFSLPVFSQTSYTEGYYELTYSIVTTAVDQFIGDNMVSQNFMLSDTLFSMTNLNDSTNTPANGPYYRPSAAVGSYSACIHFMDPNASRIAAMGVTFAASTTDPAVLDGEYVSVYGYEWADQFTDINDANLTGVNTLNLIGVGEYTYSADLQNENIYVPFDEPMTLNDNTRYLFCVNTFSTEVYIGFDNAIDYTQNWESVYMQPISPIEDNGTWYVGGFGRDVVPGLSVNVSTNLNVEESEQLSITPYPNPANHIVNIPLNGFKGYANLKIYDLAGKLISDQNVNTMSGNLQVNVNDIPNGNYLFNITFENGKSGKFNVVITK